MKNKIWYLLSGMGLYAGMAALSAYYIWKNLAWLESLTKGGFYIPDGVLLYIGAGAYLVAAVSFLLVLLKNRRAEEIPYFALNAVLAAFYLYVFSDVRNLAGGAFLLLVLLVGAVYLFYLTYKTSKTAAYLMAVSAFAIAFLMLNQYEIVLLN